MRKGLRRTAIVIGIVARHRRGRPARRAGRRRALREPPARRHGRVTAAASRTWSFTSWPAAMSLAILTIVKRDSTRPTTPFATMPAIDLSLQWRALFNGQRRRRGRHARPRAESRARPRPTKRSSSAPASIGRRRSATSPVPAQHRRSAQRPRTFRAPGISTDDSLTLRDFQMQLRNLTNVQDIEEPAFADIDVRGGIMGNAPLTLTGQIDPNETAPTFDIDLIDRRRAARRREPVATRVPEGRCRDGRVLDVLGARSRRRPLRRLRAAHPRGPAVLRRRRRRVRAVPQSLGRPRERRGEDLGEPAGRASRDANPVARRYREPRPRYPDRRS